MDMIRLYLQRKVLFYNAAEKEEFIKRNKSIVLNYLLRNPFYNNVF